MMSVVGNFTDQKFRNRRAAPDNPMTMHGPSEAMQEMISRPQFVVETMVAETAIIGVAETPPEGDPGWDDAHEGNEDDTNGVLLVAAGPEHKTAVSMLFSSMEHLDEFCAALKTTGDAIFNNGGRVRVPPRETN